MTWDEAAGHVAFALLILALLAPRLLWARVALACYAVVGIVQIMRLGGDDVELAWFAAMLGVAFLLLVRTAVAANRARFTAEEELLAARLLPGVGRRRARHMIDQGLWLNGKPGDRLTVEGKPVEHLYFLSEGEARVMSGSHRIGMCREGDLIGEVTVLSGEPASATVILTGDARFWCAPAAKLRPYLETHDDIRRVIERSIAEALKAKLRASNRIIAENGGVR